MGAAALVNGLLSELLPERGVGERFADAEARLKEKTGEADDARAAVAAAEKRFQDVQTQRRELLFSAFEKVASVVDGIYKELTRSEVRGVRGRSRSGFLRIRDPPTPLLTPPPPPLFFPHPPRSCTPPAARRS